MLRSMLIASAAMLFAGPALADVVARQVVEKEMITIAADGTEKIERVAAEKVTPGEKIFYALHYTNENAGAADAMVLVMPVPAEVTYIEGSASDAGTTVTFSADGGTTYVVRGKLTIEESGANRPATSDEITHIKWTLLSPVAPNASGKVSYKGVLK